MRKEHEDIHTTITRQIVDAIENGPGEYRCPWHGPGSSILYPRNVETAKPYQGVNILALWVAADAKGYQSGLWGTYRQWQARGSQVQKGERGSPVVFYKELPPRSRIRAARKRAKARRVLSPGPAPCSPSSRPTLLF